MVLTSLYSCFESSEYSDLTIECKGHDFKVHKTVVCPQSAVLTNAVKKDAFKVRFETTRSKDSTNIIQEGQTGNIPLQDIDPDTVAAAIKFLYTGEYSTNANTMQFHLCVYALADLLDIAGGLKTFAEKNFKVVAESDWKGGTFPARVKKSYAISPPRPQRESLRCI